MTTPTSPAGLRVLLAEALEFTGGVDPQMFDRVTAMVERLRRALVNNAEQLIGAAERVERLTHAAQLALDRLVMLLPADLPESDHPGATSYIIDQLRQALGAQDVRGAVKVDPRDPDHSREGMFVYHNCWKCSDGAKPCVRGRPSNCEYPHARND